MIKHGAASISPSSPVDLLAAIGLTDVDRPIEVHLFVNPSQTVFLGDSSVSTSDGYPFTLLNGDAPPLTIRMHGGELFGCVSSSATVHVLASTL